MNVRAIRSGQQKVSTMSSARDKVKHGLTTTTKFMHSEDKVSATIAMAGGITPGNAQAKAKVKVKPEEEQAKAHQKEESREAKVEEEKVLPAQLKVEVKVQAKQKEKLAVDKKVHVGTVVKWVI